MALQRVCVKRSMEFMLHLTQAFSDSVDLHGGVNVRGTVVATQCLCRPGITSHCHSPTMETMETAEFLEESYRTRQASSRCYI